MARTEATVLCSVSRGYGKGYITRIIPDLQGNKYPGRMCYSAPFCVGEPEFQIGCFGQERFSVGIEFSLPWLFCCCTSWSLNLQGYLLGFLVHKACCTETGEVACLCGLRGYQEPGFLPQFDINYLTHTVPRISPCFAETNSRGPQVASLQPVGGNLLLR